jgi:hypothetical protein
MNAEWDKKEGASSKFVNCDSKAVRDACLSVFKESGGNRFLPNGSMQGIELADGGSIYIVGGASDDTLFFPIWLKMSSGSIYVVGGASDDTPKIGKMSGTGGGKVLKNCTHSNFNGSNNKREMEGVQLKGDLVYFGITNPKLGENSGRWRIYSIPKTAF